jgi:anaerobic selenocysteine-containing dehydrogenase
VTTVLRTACPLDCPDACSLVATVENDRLVALDGDERNPLTGGFICAKVRRLARHLYGEDRLLHPAIADGPKGSGRFRRASWNEALDLVAARLRAIRDRLGGEAILPFSYGGSNGALTEGTVDVRLFRRLGASALLRTACAMPSGRAAEGLYGRMPGVDLADYVHAQLVVLWGVNPSASGIHHVPVLQEAMRRGARLVVVDPRRTPLAGKADLHLRVKPGTDVVLALAVIRWLFANGRADEAFLREHATGVEPLRACAEPWTLDAAARQIGIDAADIETFARMFADASPAVVRMGWGLERNRNGGSACAAVLALPAVGGKFGVRGGGYTASNSRAFEWDLEPAINEPAPDVRRINMVQLGRVLVETRDPPVGALFVYNCNPLSTMPEQERVRRGLLRDDLFTVVFDQVMTDTARYADVLLPATAFVEHDDLKRGYGAAVVQLGRRVVAPHGEARSNPEVFADLIERLGLRRDDDPVGTRDLVDAIVASTSIDRQRFAEHGLAERERGPVLFVDAFPRTPSGKVHLFPPELDAEARAAGSGAGLYAFRPDPGTTQHPLALISPGTSRTVSSTFGQLVPAPARLAIHPHDAAARSIVDGTTVRVWNDEGEIVCPARVTDEVRPGVVELPKGLWARHTFNGLTANAVCPAAVADLGGGATYNDARVQVERYDRPSHGGR